MINQLMLSLFCLLLTGCNIVGAMSYAVSGPPMQPAQFKPARRPTLVMVESYSAPSGVMIDGDRFASLLTEQLRVNDVVPTVAPAALYGLRERSGANFSKLTVSQIGRELGADQVIYVDLLGSGIEQAGGTMMRGKMSMRIRIIDTQSAAILWPVDAADGLPVVYSTPMQRLTETDNPEILKTRMLNLMAMKTARLFYDWKPADLSAAAEEGAGS